MVAVTRKVKSRRYDNAGREAQIGGVRQRILDPGREPMVERGVPADDEMHNLSP